MFGRTSGKKTQSIDSMSVKDRFYHYQFVRGLAQDAVDATEKWSDIVRKTMGKPVPPSEKKKHAIESISTALVAYGIIIDYPVIDLALEAAVSSREESMLGATFSQDDDDAEP